jgi:hypothetical protein
LAPEERTVVRKMEQDFLKHYQSDSPDAQSLLAVGDSKATDKKISPAEWAAWTLIASEILNLDESLTK